MTNRTKIFFDTEFTGLHKSTTLISIGLVDENGNRFYAELTDYDRTQVDDWLKKNVISKLFLAPGAEQIAGKYVFICNKYEEVAKMLRWWLGRYESVEMWGDVLSYDWVLFCELFGGAQNIPPNVYYIPFDLATFLKENGIDPDINRGQLGYNGTIVVDGHIAVDDAVTAMSCYQQVVQQKAADGDPDDFINWLFNHGWSCCMLEHQGEKRVMWVNPDIPIGPQTTSKLFVSYSELQKQK